MSAVTPVIVVHGGAGSVSAAIMTDKLKVLRQAVDAGFALLQAGQDTAALDAVEAAVRVMEDHSSCNAGYGSSLTLAGEVEMDALIMEGTQMKAGAVGAVRRVRHPVTLARRIMEKTDHVFLVGHWADDFAAEVGEPLVDNQSLVSSRAVERLEEHKTFLHTVKEYKDEKDHDTVGAVAVDSRGRVACATSTGGLTGKRPGRVGDSPLVGAGGIADDVLGAVSTTGHGEALMRSCLALRATQLLERGLCPQEAVDGALKFMRERTQGSCGGIILATPAGVVATGCTTEMMPWVCRTRDTLRWGTVPGENHTEPV
ncbi:asparaginase, putative [Ixodes scapularis]|uniref:Asparaginase, putative n=1 Tax=Ixodes scapularis TaxID=6945 RepID=B7P2K5_IXOSC|nr:asparaginase, putative [Ixodes scapularis]|eukprot:XP_002402465.1 asparaginase, putative [Ixodes scapularis]